jgi:hypothetical protein
MSYSLGIFWVDRENREILYFVLSIIQRYPHFYWRFPRLLSSSFQVYSASAFDLSVRMFNMGSPA